MKQLSEQEPWEEVRAFGAGSLKTPRRIYEEGSSLRQPRGWENWSITPSRNNHPSPLRSRSPPARCNYHTALPREATKGREGGPRTTRWAGERSGGNGSFAPCVYRKGLLATPQTTRNARATLLVLIFVSGSCARASNSTLVNRVTCASLVAIKFLGVRKHRRVPRAHTSQLRTACTLFNFTTHSVPTVTNKYLFFYIAG